VVVHLLTGDLFLLANGLIAWHTVPEQSWIAAIVLPLTTGAHGRAVRAFGALTPCQCRQGTSSIFDPVAGG
jgi:hypothetical protein